MQPTRYGRAQRISVHKCKAEDKRSNLISSSTMRSLVLAIFSKPWIFAYFFFKKKVREIKFI